MKHITSQHKILHISSQNFYCLTYAYNSSQFKMYYSVLSLVLSSFFFFCGAGPHIILVLQLKPSVRILFSFVPAALQLFSYDTLVSTAWEVYMRLCCCV